MSKHTPIIIPQDNVNDESVTVVAWLVARGDKVCQGQKIAEVETSKAVMDIETPVDGIVEYSIEIGSDVEIGAPLCHILHEVDHVSQETFVPADINIESPKEPQKEPFIPKAAGPLPEADGNEAASKSRSNEEALPTQFSKKAKVLLEQRGLSPEQFSGRGLMREEDILRELGEYSGQSRRSAKPFKNAVKQEKDLWDPIPAFGVPFRSEKLGKSKRTEIGYLTSGSRNTLPSMVSVAIPTQGLRVAVEHHLSARTNATAIIIFEVARLLHRYPRFNGFYQEEHVNVYGEINIGLAIDADKGLKVPVIRKADTKGIQEISNEIQELIIGYLNNSLSPESLQGGTFTVTDLSGEGVFSFQPLINQGQSGILGIGAEFFPPGSTEGMFNLILGFDHQVSEGRSAAKFLGELREHLQAYEKTIKAGELLEDRPQPSDEPFCSRCLTTLGKLNDWDRFDRWDHFMVPITHIDGKLGHLCSVCLRGW